MIARSTTRAAAIAIAATLAPAQSTLAAGDEAPDKIFVYNGGTPDQYNHYAQVWAFEQACLLGPNNEFPQIDGDELKIDSDGDGKLDTVTGTVIKDADDNVIGYESLDGTKRVYDINTSATFLRAWNEVDGEGEIIVAKHGFRLKPDPNDTTKDVTGIILDDGFGWIGFKPDGGSNDGTADGGYGDFTPYCLPPREGDSIDLWLNTCHSRDDPDRDGKGRRSVGDTAGDVDGVDQVRGNFDCVEKCVTYSVTRADGTDTPPDVYAALKNCAFREGFYRLEGPYPSPVGGWWGAWLASLDPEDVEQAVRDCLRGAGIDPDGYIVGMTPAKTEGCVDPDKEPGSGSGTALVVPDLPLEPLGALLVYAEPDPDATLFAATALIPPAPEPVLMHMYPQGASIALLPDPLLVPATPAVFVEPYNPDVKGPPLVGPFQLDLRFGADHFDHNTLEVLTLLPGDEIWQPFPAEIFFDKDIGFALISADFKLAPGPFLVAGVPNQGIDCLTDFDGNGVVNAADVGAFISQYFVDLAEGTLLTDFDGNGVVNAADVGAFITQYFNDIASGLCS